MTTILVVDDNDLVLTIVTAMLERHGYLVLKAAEPAMALRIEQECGGKIDLLLSDISMPQMSGAELARQLQVRRPWMRVMLMSAYADGALLILSQGWTFPAKPFAYQALLAKVADVLQLPISAQGSDHFDTRK